MIQLLKARPSTGPAIAPARVPGPALTTDAAPSKAADRGMDVVQHGLTQPALVVVVLHGAVR